MKSALPLVGRWEASLLLLSALAAAGCGGRGTLYADGELGGGVGGVGSGSGGTSSGGVGSGGAASGGTGGGALTGGSPAVGGATGRFCRGSRGCDDFDLCTIDVCTEGVCRHVDAVDDGDPCTIDYCDAGRGPQHVLAVDDGDPCTDDFCDPATGVFHRFLDVDDGNSCTIDYCDAKLGVVHEPIDVNDFNACTVDRCDADFGPVYTDVLCEADACSVALCDPVGGCMAVPRGCLDNDGCCSSGCTANTDNDCCGANLATSATPLKSGGGVGVYGPAQLNNGLTERDDCSAFAWVHSEPSASFEYAWPTPVTIRSLHIDTVSGPNGNACNPSGRNVSSATVQYWTGSLWATSTTFSDQHDDVVVTLPSPVATTRLRLMDVTSDSGNGNPLIHEWYVYGASGCTPPQ